MNNLKIEYVDGQLVTVDVEGVSMLDAGLTGLSFEHYLGKDPHLKFEVGGGSPAVNQPQAKPQLQAEPQVKEGELIEGAPNAPRARPPRNKNRNRNRNH